MVFSNFTRTVLGTTILFKNEEPIRSVDFIKFYKDNASGTFIKKEFRWSFNTSYWSSWETLNQQNLTNIDADNNPYLYLEVRYIIPNTNSKVTSFSIEYKPTTRVVSTTTVTPTSTPTPTPTEEEEEPVGDTIQSFSNFVRSQSGTQILFKNAVPINRVSTIKYYLDNAAGAFSKKEFRWSFNNSYWSSWESLIGLSRITVFPNKQLYLEIRYTQTAEDVGTVSVFTVHYTQLAF